MRLIGKAAIAMAMTTLVSLASQSATAQGTPAPATPAGEGTKVAVVDVAFIFKNAPDIKAQVAKVESDLKNYGGEMEGKREQLQAAAAKLKDLNRGTPDYAAQEEAIASMESKLRLDMARKKKELADAEARIYYDNYQRIAEGVKFLAQHYKINLVLRYNSEDMDLDKGESVIRGVMKNIVYHDDNLDMTRAVMAYLERYSVANGGAPAAAPATTR